MIQIFTFPKTIEQIQLVQDKSKLQQALQIMLKDFQNEQVQFHVRVTQEKYMYAKCKFCSSKLIYLKINSGKFKLMKYSIMHYHSDGKGNHRILKRKIQNLSNCIKASQAYQIFKKQAKISKATFYRIYNSVKNVQYKIPQMFNNFQQQKIIGHYQPLDSKLPSLIILTSQLMQKNFQSFGQFCVFDITYNLIHQRSQEDKKYGVGFIVGINNNMKIIPYAVVFTDQQHKQRMAKIFYQFFKLMGKTCQTIITDEQASIQAGLQLLRYQNIWHGQHLIDSFHLLRNVRKNLINKQNIKYFSELMKAENEFQYKSMLDNLRDHTKNQSKATVQKFLQQSNKHSFAKIYPQLVGFSISSSICQKTNDLIKSEVPFSKSLGVVMKKSMNLCKSLILKSTQYQIQKMPIQIFFNFSQIQQLKVHLCKKVFHKLVRNILKSLHSILKVANHEKFIVYDQFGQFTVQIDKTIQNLSFRCNCLYIQKTGIPCLHLIKVALLKDKKIIQFIDQRWLIPKQTIRKHINESRPIKTRRRR